MYLLVEVRLCDGYVIGGLLVQVVWSNMDLRCDFKD